MSSRPSTIPAVAIFVRHSADCPHKDDGEDYRGCRCRKHLRWSYRNKQFRVSAKTRSWSEAEKAKRRIEADFGTSSDPVVTPTAEKTTVRQAIDSFLMRKGTEGVTAGVLGKYTRELARLQTFFAGKSKFFPEQISLLLLEEFRATWTTDYPSSYTRQKVQERVKGFLNYCHDAHWLAHVPKLSAIKVVEPPTLPLSDKEYETLLGKVPIVFSDARRIARVLALVRLMRHSGLAIGDAVVLERSEMQHDTKKKLYRIVTSRQKTGTHVSVPIPTDVAEEALVVLNGNPKYFFWTGNGKPRTAVTNWQAILRTLFQGTFGEDTQFTPHCLRDTFAVDLLGKGVPLEEVSKLLGHTTVKTTEKHYAPWVTSRQDRLDALVTGTWKQHS